MKASICFRCPTCQARIKAPSQLLGRTRTCPGCGSPFTVRPAAPEDAGPLLLLDDNKPPFPKKQFR